MKPPKDFMTKKQQWISFFIGIIILILYMSSFINFWNQQEKLVQIVMTITFIPIFLLLIFSGVIYKKYPHFYEILTGYDPYEMGRKGPGFIVKDAANKFIVRLIKIIVVFIILFLMTLGILFGKNISSENVIQNFIAQGCVRYFDGCNTCFIDGTQWSCTEIGCPTYAMPRCLEYQ